MTEGLTLKVIVTSTRPGRQGRAIADWFIEYAQHNDSFTDIELVDLVDINLPLFNEPNHPNVQDYIHDHTKAWSKIVASADAFVFVLPEYNYFAPPSVINALDYLHHEWKYKVAGIVSYGGMSGGMRAAQSLKPLLANLGMMPPGEGVFLPFFKQFIDETTGKFVANETHEQAANRLLGELGKWAGALQPLHHKQ